ncbi:MAG: hypothetical protein KDC45_07770 [Bacteroidetes bacterium]|nr:hypothetical protein [Bacteroidota bacterium]
MSLHGVTLTSITNSASHLLEVKKESLRVGDWIFAKTMNSVYRVRVVGGGLYEVSGGWFDARGLAPAITRINGCTWGSRVIKTNIVAACGMSIEFPKRIVTSIIVSIVHVPNSRSN